MDIFQHMNLRPNMYLGMVDGQLSYNSFVVNALLALMDLLPAHNDKSIVLINMMADFLTIRVETNQLLVSDNTDFSQVFHPEFARPVTFFQYVRPIVWFSEFGLVRFQSTNQQYDGIINNRLVARWNQVKCIEKREYFQIHFAPIKEVTIEKRLDRKKILTFMQKIVDKDLKDTLRITVSK
jgi:hypothetical protein